MHSTILATSQGLPTLTVPYEPKGIEYMKRLGMPEWTISLSVATGEGGAEALARRIGELWADRDGVRSEICRRIPKMRERASRSIEEAIRSLIGGAPSATPTGAHEGGAVPVTVESEDETCRSPN